MNWSTVLSFLTFGGLSFANPVFLFLLVFPALVIWQALRQQNQRKNQKKQFGADEDRGLSFPDLDWIKRVPASPWIWLRHGLWVLRAAAMVFLIFALARPQRSLDQSKRSVEGLDIIMVIDTSGSMLTQDFALGGRAASRVDVVKAVIAEFIRNRPDDRIGMVVFAAEAYTHAPLTFDHDALISMLDDVRPGPAGESTSIGEGLGVAVKRMQKVTAKSKVVVLLTDGGNTSGRLSPDGATQAAAEVGVKVYTIGIGGKSGGERGKKGGKADLDVDVDLLTRIATKTGGKFFLASDTDALLKIYRTIDELEKTKADFRQFRKVEEHFVIFVWPAVLCLLLEVLWTCTRFRPIQYLPSANHKPMAAHIAPGAKS